MERASAYRGDEVKRPLELRTGHRPFQLTVMASGVTSGVVGLLFPATRSSVIERAFPLHTLIIWYCTMTVFCGLVVAVTIQPDRTKVNPDTLRTKLMLEAAGLWGMGLSCASYGVAVLAVTGISALTAALFVGLFAGAAIWRAWEIRTDLLKLRRALADPAPADPPPLADPGEN